MARLGRYERKIYKMKKKIKELSLKEQEKICKQNSYCGECPLLLGHFCFRDILNELANQEIEVEDDD